MRRRTTAGLAAALSLVLAVSGCTVGVDNPWPDPTPGDSAHPVTWENCRRATSETRSLPTSMTVECGKIRVPQDWASPDDGKTFDIALMRIYTGELYDKRGSIITNPGGPGGSGLDFLPSLVTDVEGLLDDFALVSFDPRGVGQSDAIDCISDKDLDETFGADPDPRTQSDFDAEVAVAQRIADACQDKYGDQLRLFSTVQTARDLDAIRAAVGDEKLTYLGFSYGTLLGSVYAQLFPTHVRAMVLDGAVDPALSPTQLAEGQAMGFDRALAHFTAWCQQSPSRCPIAADPMGAINAALERGRTDPITGPDGRKANAGWILWGVTVALYNQASWDYLGPAIDKLNKGDASEILRGADAYAERDRNGHYSSLISANIAINCADADYPEPSEIRQLQQEWRTKYPTFGAALAIGMLNCSVWRSAIDPLPAGPAEGAPPILVIGTTGDPATPYENTQKLADTITVGHVITWEGEGHTAYPNTSCIRRAVERYLIREILPEEGLRCPAR